jgi:RimJ/RimL family protein N-acetyltransferase
VADATRLISGGLQSVRRRGLKATATLVRNAILRHVYVRDVHVWYALPTRADRPHPALKPHLRLVQADRSDVDRLLELPTISPDRARVRLRSGAELWLVLDDDDRTAFACWIFHGATPVLAAPGRTLPLPRRVASLEDSVTSPDHRGQGIAPATWALVADNLAARDIHTLLTTVEAGNTPTHKAIEKAGFERYAAVRYTRIGPRRRVEVWSTGDPLGDQLRTAIRGTTPTEPSPVALAAARPNIPADRR